MDGDNLPATLEDVGTEIASIDVGSRAYWRDEGKQDRFLALLRHKETLEAQAPRADEPDDPLALASRAEFDAACPGGDYGAYLGVMRDVADVALGVPGAGRAGFIASFQALPETIVGAMVEELQSREWISADPLDPDELAEIAATEYGKALVADWGDAAAAKIARVAERFARIADGLSQTDVDAFTGWLAGLSPAATVSVYRKLAG